MIIGFGKKESAEDDSKVLDSSGCERIFLYEGVFERKDRLDQLFEFARSGDVVVVADFNRFGSTIREVLDVVARLHENDVGLKVEKYGIVPGAALGNEFGAVCSILRSIEAQTAASSNLHRRRGRPNVLDPETQAKALQLLSSKASVLEVARVLRVSPATIYRYFPKRSGRGGTKAQKA